jgi:hypothetical protein
VIIGRTMVVNGNTFSGAVTGALYDIQSNGEVYTGGAATTGPDHIRDTLFQPNDNWCNLKPQFAESILIVPEDGAPIRRHAHRSYSTPGSHWWDRQKIELLF